MFIEKMMALTSETLVMSDKPSTSSYGVRRQTLSGNCIAHCTEQVCRNGFAVLDSGFSDHEIASIGADFDQIAETYHSVHTLELLATLGEADIVRMPMSISRDAMLKVALNARLLDVISSLIDGAFVLNQQNLITNPSKRDYSQSSWHRDLPYQHFTSSTPLAVNAIYCVDDFTHENGASYVIPGSHLHSDFPSVEFVADNGVQLSAKAGSYIIVDCMTYHRGGFNQSAKTRRAINHVFNIPYFKQQIAFNNIDTDSMSEKAKSILAIGQSEPSSIKEYLQLRADKQDLGS